MDPAIEARLARIEARQNKTDDQVAALSKSVQDSVASQLRNHNELKVLLAANQRASTSLFKRLTSTIAAFGRRSPEA